MSSLRDDDLRYVWHPFQQAATYRHRQLVVTGGEGPYLISDEGQRYLDAISGLWNVNLGYSERRIVNAMLAQLERMPFTSLIVFSHEPSIRLAKALIDRVPVFEKVFFTSGGSEGIETAVKLARHAMAARGEPVRQAILALRGAYHGMSYGALSATGIPDDRWQFGALVPGVHHVASPQSMYGDPDAAAKCLSEFERAVEFYCPNTIAAILVEPVMGVGGMIPPPPGFLEGLRKLTEDIGALLIFDEVASGFGRTGALFAAQKYGVMPDVLVLAKGLSAGYAPLGAVLIGKSLCALCESSPQTAFMHGFTYGGSPAGCSAALKCLEILEEERLFSKVTQDGSYFLSALEEALRGLPHVRNIRGSGLMIGLDLVQPKAPTRKMPPAFGDGVRRIAREHHVIIRPTYGGATFNFAPPFICTREELDRIAKTVRIAVETAARDL